MTGVVETLLVVNAGCRASSSSCSTLSAATGCSSRSRVAGGIGTKPHLAAKDAGGTVLIDETYPPDQAADLRAALGRLEAWLVGRLGGVPRAIGHRVVHGGPDFAAPTLVDDAVLDCPEQLVPLAPLHQEEQSGADPSDPRQTS